ncbi:MAG TPA: hypothetical protein VM536_08150 [Chloroflexia bacterium]|nr:hypothetical protein [Chloroflexia bacterium]
MMHFLKQHLAWVAVAVLALGLLGQLGYRMADRPAGVVAHASWDLKPKNFDDVVAAADTIVEGQVESVAAGPDIVVPAKGEPSGEDRIPTQQVTIRVRNADKGNAQSGGTVTVFRTGGVRTSPATIPQRTGPTDEHRGTFRQADQPGGKGSADVNGAPPPRTIPEDPSAPKPNARATVFELTDDPAYQPGQRVYLLLRDGPNGTKAPVSPVGRYNIGADNRLHAVTDHAVAMSVEGLSVADAHAAGAGRLHIPNNPNVQKRVETGEPGMPTTGTADWSGLVAAAAAVVGLFTAGFMLRRRRA